MMESRVPVVDLGRLLPRLWNAGDPIKTHAFNALSFLFPNAERFFITVVREVLGELDHTEKDAVAEQTSAFVAQEWAHSAVHDWCNRQLAHQGYKSPADGMIATLQRQSFRDFKPLTRLAIV